MIQRKEFLYDFFWAFPDFLPWYRTSTIISIAFPRRIIIVKIIFKEFLEKTKNLFNLG
jgi:hypothetical protein